MPVSQEERMSTDYVITVRGHLDEQWSAWFEGMTITNTANGEALLAGPVIDQAALHGLLIKIRDLGLPLIAVVPRSRPENDGTGKSDT
jgi:hypothetical protein